MLLQATTPIKLAPDVLTREGDRFDPATYGLPDKEIAWLLDIGAAVAVPDEPAKPDSAESTEPPARKPAKA
ncbi:MAG: hypothetical protein RLY71_430 [Pseudomonadota bacterium]|jgi:hypothetical protein